MSAISHEAAIAISQFKAAGRLADSVAALLARIAELEAELDDQEIEAARLRHVEQEAEHAVAYHRRGKFDDPFHDQFWDANEMVARMDALGVAISGEL